MPSHFLLAMSASMYNGSSLVSVEDLQFPIPDDLVNYTSPIKPVVAMIPPRLIEERSQLQNTSSGTCKSYLPTIFNLCL